MYILDFDKQKRQKFKKETAQVTKADTVAAKTRPNMKKAEKQFQKARKKVPGNKILNNCLARYIKPDNKVKGVSYLGRVEAETNHNILFVILHQIIQKTLRINEKDKNL